MSFPPPFILKRATASLGFKFSLKGFFVMTQTFHTHLSLYSAISVIYIPFTDLIYIFHTLCVSLERSLPMSTMSWSGLGI